MPNVLIFKYDDLVVIQIEIYDLWLMLLLYQTYKTILPFEVLF